MKLIVTMKLSDSSLANHIYPITKLKHIEKIIIVRDIPGEEINKVKYLTPSQLGISSSVLMIPIKFFQIMRSSLSEKPILIHSYLLFPHGYLAFFAGKLTGRKVGVSLIAGPVEAYTFGGSPIGKYSYCQSLPKSTIINRVIMFVLKRFDVITVTGTYTKNYLITNGIDEDKIWIMPHVVDKRFRPLDINKDYDLIFIGRLVEVKHVETIIKAIAKVKDSIPLVKLAIVGDGVERNKLEKLTYSLDLTGQIEFVGYQANTYEWYNRSKISLLTSEREGFPYTVIESLKCGVPVIVSNSGDVTDLVKDRFNGRIISDYRDYNAYSEVIIELLKDPDLLAYYSKNCLKSFENDVSLPVENIWEQIISVVLEDKGNNANLV